MRVLDTFATRRRENLLEVRANVELIEGDMRSYERVSNAVRGCEVVLHQTARPPLGPGPSHQHATNVTGR